MLACVRRKRRGADSGEQNVGLVVLTASRRVRPEFSRIVKRNPTLGASKMPGMGTR